MSGGGEKTEKPTPRRLADARKKGQVAKSADFNAALILGGIVIILMTYGTYFFNSLSRIMRAILRDQLSNPTIFGEAQFLDLFNGAMFQVMMVAMPILIGSLVIGIFGNVLQIQFMFSLDPLKPNLGKLNPISGFKRIFSQRSVVEMIKGILKMTVVASVSFGVIRHHLTHLMSMTQMGFAQSCLLIFQVMLNTCAAIAIVMIVIGLADWWYQKYNLTKQLKMTRQEVKDEMKNTEGNPEMKHKIRHQGRAMLRKQTLQAVPIADVLITNPTHFAIAIQYDPDIAPAPRVIAKGTDHLALKMREIARENGVPIVENRPLARTLHAMVEVEHMIPPDLFIAVAEVLAYVFKKNMGRRKRKAKTVLQEA